MPRNIKSASSSSSRSDTLSSMKNYTTGEYSMWNLIKRTTNENAFCLTSKYRMNAKIHRISDVTVTRTRRDVDFLDNDVTDSDGSSSDISQDWEHFDDEDDDLEDLYNMITSQPNMRVAASSILTMTKMMSYKRQHSGAPDALLIEETAKTGTRAQKMYLKKCDELESAFCKRFLHSLVTGSASISHQFVGNKGVEACIIALTQSSNITVLDLSDNNIGFKGAKYVAMLLKENKTITDLNISDNNIGVRGAKYLTEVIGDSDRIVRFNVANNCLQEKDAIIFKHMLEETRNLKYLNLSQNGFREEGGVILGDALSYNDGLEELDLSWNHIRRDGSAGLAEGLLDNTSMKTLHLAWNGFYLEGCRVLERTLVHNTTLETLDLTNNRINRECVDHMARGLAKNKTLRTLILKLNPLTSDGAYDVLQFINECPSSGIKLLDLGTQQVDAGFELLLTEIQMQHRSVKVIYGQVIGRRMPLEPDLERNILKEHAALVLIEYANLMGFRLIDLFASLDRTGTRAIEKEELFLGLKIAGIPFADTAIKKLVSKLDLNKDGLIDIREVLTAEQEHADQVIQLKEAQEERNSQKMNAIPIWRIRSRMRRVVVQKLTDFNLFKNSKQRIINLLKLRKRNTEVSEQLVKQINSVIDAKHEEMEKEEERKRMKKNRSLSIPGNDIPTTKLKQLRRIHAENRANEANANGETGEASEGTTDTGVDTMLTDHVSAHASPQDAGNDRPDRHGKKGVKSYGWTLEPHMEDDIDDTGKEFETRDGNASGIRSTFSRISDGIGVSSTKKPISGDHRVDGHDEFGVVEDDVEDMEDFFDDEHDHGDHAKDKTASVSTASKTFRRNTIGTLKLGSNGDKGGKR